MPADVNHDGIVTVTDLRLLFYQVIVLGPGPFDPTTSARYMIEVDKDGYADVSDLRIVFSTLLSPPAQSEPDSLYARLRSETERILDPWNSVLINREC